MLWLANMRILLRMGWSLSGAAGHFCWKRKILFFFDHHKNDKNSLYHQFRRWGGIFIGLKFDSTVSYACWDLGGQKHAVGEFLKKKSIDNLIGSLLPVAMELAMLVVAGRNTIFIQITPDTAVVTACCTLCQIPTTRTTLICRSLWKPSN